MKTHKFVVVPEMTKEQKLESFMDELSDITNNDWYKSVVTIPPKEMARLKLKRQDEICLGIAKIQVERI